MIGGKGTVLGIARHIDMNAIILAFNTSPNISTANFQPGRVLFWLGHLGQQYIKISYTRYWRRGGAFLHFNIV